MKEKKYLTEENYQKSKKKIKIIALFILLCGLLIGGGLIGYGIIQISNVDKINEERYQEAYQEAEAEKQLAEQQLSTITDQIAELDSQILEKNNLCNSLDQTSSTWFQERTQCQSEVSSLRVKRSELAMKKSTLEMTNTMAIHYDKASKLDYVPWFMIGGFIALVSCMIAGSIYFITKRREILAFSMQQVMPIAKEGIEEMAPTVGKAGGTIAKEIAKGIKEGLQDEKNEK